MQFLALVLSIFEVYKLPLYISFKLAFERFKLNQGMLREAKQRVNHDTWKSNRQECETSTPLGFANILEFEPVNALATSICNLFGSSHGGVPNLSKAIKN